MSRIAVACEDAAKRPAAAALARSLELPLVSTTGSDIDFVLLVTATRLELRKQAAEAPGPIYVDFVAGRSRHRRLYGGGRGQTLARAVGLRRGRLPSVIDATAGLGRDAFVLASLGCRVSLLERSPIIAALLEDGLRRARLHPDTGIWASKRMHCLQVDAIAYLEGLAPEQRPEVVYLDPMYPERRKSALVRKELQVLREIVEPLRDEAALLRAARGAATGRVVVKRPKGAPALGDAEADATMASPNTRYDIYLS